MSETKKIEEPKKKGFVQSVKGWMKKRKKKAAAKREADSKRNQERGKEVIKQVRGAYDQADSAFGNIHRARRDKEEEIEKMFKE